MKEFPQIDTGILEGIARILGDSIRGLNEKETTIFLEAADIPDVMPAAPTWIRLYNAFAGIQKNTSYSNNIIAFIHKVMKPNRYKIRLALFKWRQENLNRKLVFAGLELQNNGKLKLIKPREYIDKARDKTEEFKSLMSERNILPEIIEICQPDLIADNYFMIVFEACKLLTDFISKKTGLREKGITLIEKAFEFDRKKKPLLAINKLDTSSELREQHAFRSLLTGLIGQFRLPTASKPAIRWQIDREDALDLLSFISMIRRKLEQAHIYID